MLCRVDVYGVPLRQQFPGQRVHLHDALHLIPPELHPHRHLLIGGLNLQRIAPDAEPAPGEVDVIPFVLHVNQLANNAVPFCFLALSQADHKGVVLLGRAEAIDAGDRGHDDHISPGEERPCRGVAQLIDLLVYIYLLLDIGIGAGDIGLRLVVVVVADEVLHRVLGEELLQLGGELSGEGLVVGHHQGGSLNPLDDVGHGEGLTAAGDPQQRLVPVAALQPLDQLVHRLGLVAGREKVRHDLERWHFVDLYVARLLDWRVH